MTERTLETRLGWLAGIIDGEGWIGVGVETLRANSSGRKRDYYAARWNVHIQNTDAAMLAEIMAIADVLGVRSKYCHKAERRPNRKPQARVIFDTYDSCEDIITAVLPYLITKRSQAELMLRALAHRRRHGHQHFPKQWVPVSRDTEFRSMAAEMHRMNQRGTNPVEDQKWPEE